MGASEREASGNYLGGGRRGLTVFVISGVVAGVSGSLAVAPAVHLDNG